MTRNRLLLLALLLWPLTLGGQGRGLDPAELLKPLSDNWPTYSGDYTGRRYSALTQANRLTVKNLTLAWTMGLQPGP
jgi:alcohol dehydrogenase (cytochrome c)